ncbi:MAG: response regulator, partial [Fimbriimonadaceae bacterium]|nr:response regulator [Alphaproteobacteria bacterium]
MTPLAESTLVMVDDTIDEIFLTRRQVRRDGIINRFVSENKPERLMETLSELIDMGVEKSSFLILLDVNMPRTNGFETLKNIRAHDEYKNVPVIMLSASDDEADILESYD